MCDMTVYCRHHPVNEILAIAEVEERLHVFQEHEELAEMQIRRCATINDNVVVADLGEEDPNYVCNRFLLYGIYPSTQVSINAPPGDADDKILLAVGKSILNRGSNANIGLLMLEQGGGGHEGVGTCQIVKDNAENVLVDLIGAAAGAGRHNPIPTVIN